MCVLCILTISQALLFGEINSQCISESEMTPCLFCPAHSRKVQCAETCSFYSNNGVVHWPKTKAFQWAHSDPMCLSENWEIEYRYCLFGDTNCYSSVVDSSDQCEDELEEAVASHTCWGAPPPCEKIQEDITNPCVDGMSFRSDYYMCVMVLDDTSYPPNCPYKEVVDFSKYSSLKQSVTSEPIWMPVQREIGDYGIGLMYWVEPYEKYYDEYSADRDSNWPGYKFTGQIGDKNCLIYYNNSLVELVSCEENHTAICAYEVLHDRANTFCSQVYSNKNHCKQSQYSADSPCFCNVNHPTTGQLSDDAELAEFIYPYQNELYATLTAENCAIGLVKENGTFIWSSSRKEIEYTNWAEDVSFEKDNTMGVFTNKGWILVNTLQNVGCSIQQKSVMDMSSAEISLSYDSDECFSLTLTYSTHWLWNNQGSPYVFCFTDSREDELIQKILPVFKDTNSENITFTVCTLDSMPGYYWCEAHVYPNIVKQMSNEILHRADNFKGEYVAVLKYKYDNDNPISSSYLKKIVKELKDEISYTNFFPRIYKILDINETEKNLLLSFHLSYEQSTNDSDEFSALEKAINNNLIKFEPVEFLNTDYCIKSITPAEPMPMHWPSTPVNYDTNPLGGYCVKRDGTFVKRRCTGNFTDGARWSPVDEGCTYYESTNITDTLVGIINEEDKVQFIDNIKDLTAWTSNLTMLDVYLISKYLSGVTCKDETVLPSLAAIVSNLMDVPKSILKSSQEAFNTTDLILHHVDQILVQCDFESKLVEKNFAVITTDIADSSINGVTVETLDSEYIVNTITTDKNLTFSNLEGAVRISNDLFKQIISSTNNPRLIVSVHLKNTLFNEMDQSKSTSIIFGVLLPNFDEEFGGPVNIFFNENGKDTGNYNCSHWQFDAESTDNISKGFWENDDEYNNLNNYVICHFYHLTHFAAVSDNITFDLESILNSISVEDNIEKLADISESSNLFEAIDVFLLSKIFKRIYTENVIKPEILSTIINNLFHIDSEVLLEAELKGGIVESILNCYRDITMRINNTSIFEQSNMVTILSVISDIRAITVANCRKKCEVQTHNTTINPENEYENIDVTLVFSNELLEEVSARSNKVFINIFFSDYLFIEVLNERSIFSPVTVHFSERVDKLTNPIDFFFNVELVTKANVTYDCAFLYTPNKWKYIDDITNLGNSVCCRFYTEGCFALVDNSVTNTTSNLVQLKSDLNESNVDIVLPKVEILCRIFWRIDVDAIKIISDVFSFLSSEVEQINYETVDVLLSILDDLINVPRPILLSSRRHFNSTNKILDAFATIVGKFDSDVILEKANVALVVTDLSQEIKGIAVTFQHEIIRLENVSLIDQLNVKYAVLPSETLIEMMLSAENNSSSKMFAAIFFSDQLFLSNITSAIIFVKFQNFSETLPDIFSTVFYYSSESISDYQKCAFWNNGDYESWELYCGYEEHNYKNCTSKINGYFTIAESTSKNVTNMLEDILNTDKSNNEILCETRELTSFYEEFRVQDIDLVVQIFDVVNIYDDNDIQHFVSIVDNILEIEESVLQGAQNMFNSTAKILDHIIIKFSNYVNHSPPYIQYKQNNFAVNTWKPKREDICGCMLDVDSSLSFVHNDSFSSNTEIDCALILGNELLNQLKNGNDDNSSNVVITIYFNNKFFSQGLRSSSSKIFGISIPNVEEESALNISVLYNISIYNTSLDNTVSDLSECAVWSKDSSSSEWFWDPTYNDDTILENVKQCDFQQGQHFTIIGKSSVTEVLEEIRNDGSDIKEKLENLLTVMDQFALFISADIYLISEILAEARTSSDISLDTVATIVDYLLSVSKLVLYESQVKYGATDSVLLSIQNIFSKCETIGKYRMSSFDRNKISIRVKYFDSSTNIRGYELRNCRQNCGVSELIQQSPHSEDDVVDVIFSDNFINYLKTDHHKLVMIVYKNNALFQDPTPIVNGVANIVIGILVSDLESIEFDSPVSIYYSKGFFSANAQPQKCVAWDLPLSDEQNPGHWTLKVGSTNVDQGTIYCDFENLNYNFALMESEGNITSVLEEILTSPSDFSNKISSLSRLFEFFEDFSCYDLNLAVQILSNSSSQLTTHDMEYLVSIVDNIMNLERATLLECNQEYDITDAVLKSTDNLLINYSGSDTLRIVGNSFAVLTSYVVDETNFRGVLIQNCLYLNCTVLLKSSLYAGLSPKVDVDVEFSDALLNQLKGEMVIITVFFTDVLFVQEDMPKVSKIIGVLLPESIKILDGPIKISYNLPGKNTMCAFWSIESNTPSFWKDDGDPTGDATCQFYHVTHFALVETSSVQTITGDLEKILEDEDTPSEDKLVLVKNITSHQYADFEDIDIFLISKIMLQAVQQNVYNINITSSIVSDLFLADPMVMMNSQKNFNATDMILHCLDEVSRETYEEFSYVYDYFVVIITLVNNSNIGGLLLKNCSDIKCDMFVEENIIVSEISNNQDVNAAIIFSDELKEQILENTTSRVIVTIHFKNIFFNEKTNDDRQTTKVFGVLLPDLNESLRGNISFVFNTGHKSDDACAYWNYKLDNDGDVLQEGQWAKDNRGRPMELMSVCDFAHLTHFALLLLSDDSDLEPYYGSLELITHIGCTLSILGVLGIIATALLFKKWRLNTGNRILLNFSLAIMLQIIMMYASAVIFDNSSTVICAVTGAILHYSLLSEFCWMLIIAILQFRRFVEVLGGPPKFIFLKALVCGWVFPIFPVILVLALDPLNYTKSKVGLCYPSELGLYLGVYLPVAIIVVINLVIFIFIIYNVFHKKTEYRETANNEILFQWRLALLLFSMLGLTWLFGFLAQIDQLVVFAYLFCITASLQGFVMFLFFIVFNKSTRFLYAQAIKFWMYNKGFKDKI